MERRGLFLKCCLVLCLVVTGCATPPDAHGIISWAKEVSGRPRVVGTNGPLTAEQSKRVLDNMGIDDAQQRHLAVEQVVADSPLLAGNQTRVLRDGDETFPAMFAAIRSARNHINLEYFILEDVRVGRTRLGDLLIRKRRQGVAVNIIYDSFGSSDTPPAFFDRLRRAGVKIVKYNPLNPLEASAGYAPNNRDHRKILAVDGSTGIVGGVNLSKTYQAHAVGKSMGPPGSLPDQWRDTDLEIHGPAVAELEELFVRHWTEQGGPPLKVHNFFPRLSGKGYELVRIIGSAPDQGLSRYYVTLISGIRSAREHVWLMTAYFVPTHEEKEELEHAARRGVDVRLLVPAQSDSDMSVAVQHASYEDLLEAGVKIYESQGVVLHSKTVVIDGVWSVIGSSNFDYRSAVFNDEVDAVVLGQKTGGRLEEMFQQDIQKAYRITRRAVQARPFPDRVYETFSQFWRSLL